MKIYFCDGCSESIPVGDIQAGQVTTIKGKLFCRKCVPIGASAAAPAAPVRHRNHPVLIACVVGLVVHALWTSDGMGDLIGRGAEVTGPAVVDDRFERRLADLEGEAAHVAAGAEELTRKVEFQQADIETLRLADSDASRSLDQVRMESERLARGQADMGELIEKIAMAENRSEVLESRLNVLADKVYGLEKKMEIGLAVVGNGEVATSGPAVSSVDASRQTEIETLRRRLLDPDPGERFDAVHTVGYLRLKELADDLVAVLRDEDPFVRQQAMTVLGDFGHVAAVPELLDALEDSQQTLRRTAAETLVRLTGYDPEYDYKASKAERSKAIKRWREWLESQSGGPSG